MLIWLQYNILLRIPGSFVWMTLHTNYLPKNPCKLKTQERSSWGSARHSLDNRDHHLWPSPTEACIRVGCKCMMVGGRQRRVPRCAAQWHQSLGLGTWNVTSLGLVWEVEWYQLDVLTSTHSTGSGAKFIGPNCCVHPCTEQ